MNKTILAAVLMLGTASIPARAGCQYNCFYNNKVIIAPTTMPGAAVVAVPPQQGPPMAYENGNGGYAQPRLFQDYRPAYYGGGRGYGYSGGGYYGGYGSAYYGPWLAPGTYSWTATPYYAGCVHRGWIGIREWISCP